MSTFIPFVSGPKQMVRHREFIEAKKRKINEFGGNFWPEKCHLFGSDYKMESRWPHVGCFHYEQLDMREFVYFDPNSRSDIKW